MKKVKNDIISEDTHTVIPEISQLSTLNLLREGAGTNAWLETDFTYFEDGHLGENVISITGLSESGKEKKKLNHNLVLADEIVGKKW